MQTIELVERKVNVLSSPDGTWYSTFRFNKIPSPTEAERFIKSVKRVAETYALVLSDKIKIETTKEDNWRLVCTFKGMESAAQTEDLMEELKKAAKAHRLVGQQSLGS